MFDLLKIITQNMSGVIIKLLVKSYQFKSKAKYVNEGRGKGCGKKIRKYFQFSQTQAQNAIIECDLL